MWTQQSSADSRIRLNDDEREDWVNNDEPLYQAYIASGQTMQAFIKTNRASIDARIRAVLRRGGA